MGIYPAAGGAATTADKPRPREYIWGVSPQPRSAADSASDGSSRNRPQPEPIAVVCAADGSYALPLAVTLRSALANLDPIRRLTAFVIDDGLSPADRRRVIGSLTDRVSVRWVRPRRESFSRLPLWGRMPVTTYDKLLVGQYLPAEVRRAIWLDCDLLVLGDLTRLWEEDLADRHALAVPDPFVASLSARLGVAGCDDLGLEAGARYFNAGVMLIDTARWRRDDVAGHALAYLRRYRDRVFFWDQEALNAVLAGRWRELDQRWNWSVSMDRLSGDRGAPGDGAPHQAWILHFSGTLKPWTYPSRSPYHSLYYRCLDLTAWSGWRPPATWRGRALGLYESSSFRRVVYPLERRYLQLLGRVTRRYSVVDR